VELAVEELFINICSHAYPGAAGPVEITRAVVLDEDGVESLVITFSDCGSPFNPFEDAPPPDLDSGLEERRPGGLGILLVKSVADRFAHRGTGNGNETEIRFRARP
ncbi:MAG: ATP-binding protein, partial [Deltaproteobacteria bacterium]|jgi:anti-sigma regulatory factor (Ser/Thr protein kinase)|nr:ATP-binding protein [Deltaproteobacteria bacterium]